MKQKSYSIFLISNRPERYAKIQESLLPELLYYFDGTDIESFSQLVNKCVESSHTETVILVGDKAYPTQQDIHKMINLLDKGYGFVGLYRFGCFGFKKELLRKIGMFDERYVGGGNEDHDMILRIIMSNIAIYVTEEIKYIQSPSSWNSERSVSFWNKKWSLVRDTNENGNYNYFIEKKIDEDMYNYNLGLSDHTKFLSCYEHSYVGANIFISTFLQASISSTVPVQFINSNHV